MNTPVIDPEWDATIAALSTEMKATGQYARTTLKGGSLIIKKREPKKK